MQPPMPAQPIQGKLPTATWTSKTEYALQLGQLPIYRNIHNHNIVSIQPITVSIYRNIDRNISTYFRWY